MFAFFRLLKNYKLLLFILALLTVLAVPLGSYFFKVKQVERLEVKVKSLEDNITFSEVERVVELENLQTQSNFEHRTETLIQLIEEIENETNSSQEHCASSNSKLFDRVFFY